MNIFSPVDTKATKIDTLTFNYPLLLMAPRRSTGGPTTLDLFGLDTDSAFDSSQTDGSVDASMTRCCVPTGECLKTGDFGMICLDDLRDTVRVVCTNDSCTVGQYMHRECFESWEDSVLTYLKSIGRARSWSDKQRQQNLWTKKGYDLVFKACGCRCGRGHIKKDLDWVPPTSGSLFGRIDDDNGKKKKKRNRNNQKPTLAIATSPNSYHPNSQLGKFDALILETPNNLRGRANSLSSSNGSSSPPVSSSEQSISPVHNTSANKSMHQSSQQQLTPRSKVEIYSDRVRWVLFYSFSNI